jgi:hypothetical protein
MHFFLGAINGVLVTILTVFFVDALTTATSPDGPQSQRIVNWDVAGERLVASTEVIRKGAEGLRDQVHELTRWMDQEQAKRVCLEFMAPMVREFTKTVGEMRRQGASEADIATMLDKIEMNNRGTVEDAVLDTIMSELRRVAHTPAVKT